MGIDLKERINKKLPAFTSILIILSAATILFYMTFSIIPGYLSIKKIRRGIEIAATDMGVLDKLIPAFAKAKKNNDFTFEPTLPFPHREKLDRENLPGLINRLQVLALKYKLDISGNKLDITFSDSESDSLSVFLELQGQLPDFRNFLISLISLPFFETMEKIIIRTADHDANIFSVTLKVNIENKHE